MTVSDNSDIFPEPDFKPDGSFRAEMNPADTPSPREPEVTPDFEAVTRIAEVIALGAEGLTPKEYGDLARAYLALRSAPSATPVALSLEAIGRDEGIISHAHYQADAAVGGPDAMRTDITPWDRAFANALVSALAHAVEGHPLASPVEAARDAQEAAWFRWLRDNPQAAAFTAAMVRIGRSCGSTPTGSRRRPAYRSRSSVSASPNSSRRAASVRPAQEETRMTSDARTHGPFCLTTCACGQGNVAVTPSPVPAEPTVTFSVKDQHPSLHPPSAPGARPDVDDPSWPSPDNLCEDCETAVATEKFESGVEICGPCAMRREESRLSGVGRAAYHAALRAAPAPGTWDYFARNVRTLELANAVARHMGLNPADEIPFAELVTRLNARAAPAGEPVAWAVVNKGGIIHGHPFSVHLYPDAKDAAEKLRDAIGLSSYSVIPLFARPLPASAEDAKRLDWLTEQLVPEGFGWKAYHSRTERGYRLSTTRQTPNYATPREALDAARAASQSGSDR